MKVVFKLTKNELSKALEIVKRAPMDGKNSYDDAVYMGNMIGYVYNRPGLNTDVELYADMHNCTVSYEGQRNPLWADDYIRLLREVFGNKDYDTWNVIEYTSSVPEMKWHEVYEIFLLRMLSEGKISLTHVADLLYKNGKYGWKRVVAQKISRDNPKEFPALGSAEYRRACADGSLQKHKDVKRIKNWLIINL